MYPHIDKSHFKYMNEEEKFYMTSDCSKIQLGLSLILISTLVNSYKNTKIQGKTAAACAQCNNDGAMIPYINT